MSMDAEKTILSLPEVKGCRIFYDENGIDQIYVSASIPAQGSAGRLQYIKSLVRSVVGALALEYGWNVDYRKVKLSITWILSYNNSGQFVKTRELGS